MASPATSLFHSLEHIGCPVYELRGKKVVVDSDIAPLFYMSTKRLNQEVRRKWHKFPKASVVRVDGEGFKILRSQQMKFEEKMAKNIDLNFSVTSSYDEPYPTHLDTYSYPTYQPKTKYPTNHPRYHFHIYKPKDQNNWGGRRHLPFIFTEEGFSTLNKLIRPSF